ncbi:hypothetical protein LCGC14_1749600 [marine sediment metagenome]|uniref:Uncharacterized protein n=1 Tax=marine sediment metagenome TaxID=412755 RepID=A0A0F9H4C9_9ZZZZ
MKYNIFEPWKTLDPWQEKYINTEGNCFLICGRQSGKTAAASIKFGKIAAENPKEIIMMIAFTEKQAYALFFKTLMYLRAIYPQMVVERDIKKKGLTKPTKHTINLKNGSVIMCYAAGLEGEGLRTYTLTRLVIDEAAPMSREVFIATMPMLSVTGGTMDLSTPRGKAGFFYECSKREDFTHFYISAEDCPRHSKEFLEAQKTMMSTLEYAQEYLAKFLDDLKRVFSNEWIKKVCLLNEPEIIRPDAIYYMGNDLARMGEDTSTFEILKKTEHMITHVYHETTKKTLTTETEQKIITLAKQWNFKGIGIDAGAGTLGVSILDHLLLEDSTKRSVVALNSRRRVLDRDGESKIKIFNEDMYNNLLALGQARKIQLLKNDEVVESLASVQYEYIIKQGQPTKLRFFSTPHNTSDVVEGLMRAAWLAKDKILKAWVDYI